MNAMIENKRFVVKTIVTLLLVLVQQCFMNSVYSTIVYFVCAILCIYCMVIPQYFFNPKNFVMGFYFMWYGIAPLFADRYKGLTDGDYYVSLAYSMFLVTFSCSMLTLDWVENHNSVCLYRKEKQEKLENKELFCLLLVYLVALFIYIQRTGGISLWLSNPNDAFFSRGGSGIFYLLFEYSALLIFFFEGKKKGLLRKVLLFVLCLVTMYFCGSKSIMMLFLFMLFSTQTMKIKLLDKKSMGVIGIGIIVFGFGIFVRLGHYIISFRSMLTVCLSYFDTLDEFLLLLKNHSSNLFQTIYYPINWILMKFGFHVGAPYFDTSIWFTTVYYPESWQGGGTHQLPLEAYLYLNFKYWLGIPLVIAYFYLIGWIYNKGRNESGVWRFICINECMAILSHLRGGLLNYWYIYLLPFYMLLVLWEKRVNKGSISEKGRKIV